MPSAVRFWYTNAVNEGKMEEPWFDNREPFVGKPLCHACVVVRSVWAAAERREGERPTHFGGLASAAAVRWLGVLASSLVGGAPAGRAEPEAPCVWGRLDGWEGWRRRPSPLEGCLLRPPSSMGGWREEIKHMVCYLSFTFLWKLVSATEW